MHKLDLKKWRYGNVPIGELNDGQVVRVIDYWRELFYRSEWLRGTGPGLRKLLPRF